MGEDMRLVITRQAHLAGLDDEFIPITIARAESGLDPTLQKDGGYGLFQLHRGGLAQSTLTDEELLDPHVNASLAIRGMLGNYRSGKAQGLTGISLVQYVSYYSGWPTMQGPDYVAEHFPDYGKKLAAAYLEERAAEEADSGHIVKNEAPPIPDILKEPDSGLVKQENNLPQPPKPEEPKPEPEGADSAQPEPVKEPEAAEQSEDKGRADQDSEPPAPVDKPVETVDNVQPQEPPTLDYAAISLHTGIPTGILEAWDFVKHNRFPNVYRVKANETFEDICKGQGVEPAEIEKVNRIYPDKLYSGQVIYL